MKYFAEINEDNYVVNTIVVSDEDSINLSSNYIEYSKSGEFRYNPAGIGLKYNSEKDGFEALKPYESWIWNEETLNWDPPVLKPEGPAAWDEINKRWNTPE